MKVVWSNEALIDLASLRDYILSYNIEAAKRIAFIIANTVNHNLANNPELGRPGRVPGTRELIVPRTPVKP